MADASTVACAEHGPGTATFVCRHLPAGQGAGFHQGFGADDPDALFPDAWCDACEAVRAEEGGWNERSEASAGITLLCSACYLRARVLHWPRSTHRDTAILVERALEYLQARQGELESRHYLSTHERYHWDQKDAQLVFSNAGVPAVVADIQFVGSVSSRSQTWMWAWANASNLESVTRAARVVRAHGDEHRLLKLACGYWGAEEEDGWQMSAVAALLLQAEGVYRTPKDGGFTFLLLFGVRNAGDRP